MEKAIHSQQLAVDAEDPSADEESKQIEWHCRQ